MTKNACPRTAKSLSRAAAKRVLNQKDGIPRLVQFHSPNCGHCQEVTPEIHKAAQELCGTADVVRINVDTHEALADQFDVDGLPTVAIIQDGEIKEKVEGAGEGAHTADFLALMNKYLGK